MRSWPHPSRLRDSPFFAPFILLLLTIGLSWKLTLTDQYTWLNLPDYSDQVYPWFQFQALQWQRGSFPIWDPHHWGGQSLIGQNQPGAAYPFNWLFYLFAPLNKGLVSIKFLGWYITAIRYLGALFCYLLCRDLRRSHTASVLGGLIFGVGTYIGTTDWPQMINGAIWAPLILLFFLRSMRGTSPFINISLAGGCQGISLLSGHHQIPTFIALTVGALWIYYLVVSEQPLRRHLAMAFCFLCSAFLMSALQLVPSYEYWKLSLRWVGAKNPVGWNDRVPYSVHAQYSLNPVSILGILIPGVFAYANPFIGITVTVLAGIAIARRWSDRTLRLFAALTMGGLLFSLGAATPLHGILYAAVPSLDKSRNPSMAIFIFQFGASILAAYGLDSVRRERALLRKLILGLGGVSILIYSILLGMAFTQFDKVFSQTRPAMTGLVSLLLALLFCAWARKAVSEQGLVNMLVFLVTIEFGAVVGFYYFSREQGWDRLEKYTQVNDIVEFLRRQRQPVRVGVDRTVIAFNFGDLFGIDQFNGYNGVTENVFRLDGYDNAHMLLGENFWIGKAPNRPNQELVFQGEGGLKVYHNPDAFPKVWSVHQAVYAGRADIGARFAQPLSELRERVFVIDQLPKLETCAGDRIQVIERGALQVSIDTQMACKGMVVLGDTFFPGWKASVDGSEAPVYEAYAVVRGVIVPAGRHMIKFYYRPKSVFWGASLTILGSILFVVLLISEAWKRRKITPIKRAEVWKID